MARIFVINGHDLAIISQDVALVAAFGLFFVRLLIVTALVILPLLERSALRRHNSRHHEHR
jgi:hypothetical protein